MEADDMNVKVNDLEFKRCGNCHELSVQKEYFLKIRDGFKTVEGRAGKVDTENNIHENYKERTTSFKIGDQIRFKISGNEKLSRSKDMIVSENVTCEITGVLFYDTFKEMLVESGLSNCLPGVKSIEEGVRIYRGFNGYQKREERYGVIAIHVKVL
jgi:ASC-1-like (ASCH) protein